MSRTDLQACLPRRRRQPPGAILPPGPCPPPPLGAALDTDQRQNQFSETPAPAPVTCSYTKGMPDPGQGALWLGSSEKALFLVASTDLAALPSSGAPSACCPHCPLTVNTPTC